MWTTRFAEEALSCPVCYTTFAQPRVLPCGHTFCAACLARLRQDECPLCRTPAAIEDAPPNVVVEDLVGLVREYERLRARKRKPPGDPPASSPRTKRKKRTH